MINLWHDMDSNRITPEKMTVVIEIPMGSKKKYELDKQTGIIILDRILHTSTHYPANYGFIPKTLSDDGDPLDVLVISREKLDPMVLVDCFPIGVMKMIDNNEVDEKVIALPFGDPYYAGYKDVEDLPEHTFDEIRHFFEVYKFLENKHTIVEQVLGRKSAVEVINKSIELYNETYSNRFDKI